MTAENILHQSDDNEKGLYFIHKAVKDCLDIFNDILNDIYDATLAHVDTIINLQSSQYVRLDSYGYRYVLLFVPHTMYFKLRHKVLGIFSFTVNGGWIEVPVFEDIEIALVTEGTINFVQRCTNSK